MAELEKVQKQIDELQSKKEEIEVKLKADVDVSKLKELEEIDKQIEDLKDKQKTIHIEAETETEIETDIDKIDAEIDSQLS